MLNATEGSFVEVKELVGINKRCRNSETAKAVPTSKQGRRQVGIDFLRGAAAPLLSTCCYCCCCCWRYSLLLLLLCSIYLLFILLSYPRSNLRQEPMGLHILSTILYHQVF